MAVLSSCFAWRSAGAKDVEVRVHIGNHYKQYHRVSRHIRFQLLKDKGPLRAAFSGYGAPQRKEAKMLSDFFHDPQVGR